ncbi:MAG TPA: GNAT family N-acetyltransferase [Aliiroseovarius sp.]|nr:GNAT family N-acetyltransferase [Aliiroseovarius sp.]
MKIFWDQHGQAQWQNLADRGQAPMQQRWTYGAVHRALGGQVWRAVVTVNDQPVAICQFLGGRKVGPVHVTLASRGPVWLSPCDKQKVFSLIRRSMPGAKPRARLFTLPQPARIWRALPLMTPASIAERPLPVTRSDLPGKWRSNLKRATKFGLTFHRMICSGADLDRLITQDRACQTEKSYRALPPDFIQTWHRIAPQALVLVAAREKGRVIAEALFLQHGNSATYFLAHTSPRGRRTAAGPFLMFNAFQDLARSGVKTVDLGMIDTVSAPDLARFKLGSGAIVQRLGPTVLAI